ncbi:MAG: toll/interleukin-1 receptor domain-containing protein [Alphaproteobacteria bacterium]
MPKVFISYSHKQGEWVWERLCPSLKAAGLEVLIDRERFEAGREAFGEVDATQDQAERHLLVLSPDYLVSPYCPHEMTRAIASDPGFTAGRVVPVFREPCDVPALSGVLAVDLHDDGDAAQWRKLFRACGADKSFDVPGWLTARDEVVRYLGRGQSVNLVAPLKSDWRSFFKHMVLEQFDRLGVVKLNNPATIPREGLVAEILKAVGAPFAGTIPKKPRDLATMSEGISAKAPAHLALIHFDIVAHRNYGLDLFTTLHNLVMDKRHLVLLTHSYTPFAELLPRDHPVSNLNMAMVALP